MNELQQVIAGRAQRPAFLVTVDAEGDNIWSCPTNVTTENARHVPRFQALCEKYQLKPTYLTNYEMAISEPFVELVRDAVARGAAEVGLHIHAWNSPPMTGGETRGGMGYLVEFREDAIIQKVDYMTGLLEERFNARMVSHRAGRWVFNETYARIIADRGYLVDCSVTPNVSWKKVKGFVDGDGGVDYRGFPSEPYFVDMNDIAKAGSSPLLEVPMTIARDESVLGGATRAVAERLPRPFRRAAHHFFPPTSWFRPNGRNLGSMHELLNRRSGASYIEFMIHSSELMPGGSPTYRTEQSIEQLYDHLEEIFEAAQSRYQGATLGEFRQSFAAGLNGADVPGSLELRSAPNAVGERNQVAPERL